MVLCYFQDYGNKSHVKQGLFVISKINELFKCRVQKVEVHLRREKYFKAAILSRYFKMHFAFSYFEFFATFFHLKYEDNLEQIVLTVELIYFDTLECET